MSLFPVHPAYRAILPVLWRHPDLQQNRGFDSRRVTRKGGRRDALVINQQTAVRLRVYMELAGHADDMEGPLFRPLHHNGKARLARRAMHPDAIDRVVRKVSGAIGLPRGYSALASS